MAIDEWHIPIEPTRALKRDVASIRDNNEAVCRDLSRQISSLQLQITELTNAINELVGMITEEVKESKGRPLTKRELPPPPLPPPRYM